MIAEALTLSLALAPQDLELRGVHIHTGTKDAWPGSLAVGAGRILPPGSEAPRGAAVLDLGGAHVFPGLQDAHGHLFGLGTAMVEVDLVGTRSFEEVIEKVAAEAARRPPGQWILGRGWDQNDWADKAMPHHAELSAETPDHLVWLVRIDGHAALCNQRALLAAGITRDTEAPSGGEILRDEDGEPTGVLVDRAMALVNLPDPDLDEVHRRFLAAQRRCLELGITCVHDAGESWRRVEDLRILAKLGKWKLRTYVMLSADQEDAIRRGPWRSEDGRIVVRAVKAYADGALGSYGAALLAPYADRRGYRGLMTMPRAGIARLAQLCADHGMQLCVHAIGDAANRAVLDAFEETRFPGVREAARFRIEHCQVVSPADLPRFAELSVIPSMQPSHLTSDMPWAPTRLGPERVRTSYAFRTLFDMGLEVAFGSDFPVESADPRKGIYAAVTTMAESGGPAGGYRPDQKLDRERALRGFTRNAARAMFAEDDLGTIEPGKIADLTVFDRDILTCPKDEIPRARVLMTIIGGEIAYRAGEAR
ncbi:MAG: amidohydrolase [Planctomycetota bacterium]